MDDRARPTLPALVLAAAILAGVSYVGSWGMHLPLAASTAWKGAGVALLALYAGLNARSRDGWLICAVMGFGALGDMLIEALGLVAGAAAFLLGHLVAIGLYLRHRRPAPSPSQLLLAAVLVPATVVTAFQLPADRAGAQGVAVYALGLSLMAATAWLSRFPRYQVGAGALMFVASDLLIFARAGPLQGAAWIGLAIWGLYFTGQVLICSGVTRALEGETAGR